VACLSIAATRIADTLSPSSFSVHNRALLLYGTTYQTLLDQVADANNATYSGQEHIASLVGESLMITHSIEHIHAKVSIKGVLTFVFHFS
jgi:hypothetical protein